MNGKKKVLLALFVLAIFLGGFLVARGYPDWALNVIQKEGTTFVVTGSVDANITNTEINAYVVNSTITVEPSEGSVFEIKPATGVVFNIQGDVNATVQGTVSVSVDQATIEVGVATVRERASELNKVKSFYATEHLTSQEVRTWTIYTNEGTENAYLELVSFGATSFFDVLTDPTKILGAYFEVRLKDETGEVKAVVFGNALTTLNLDPALPIPPGWQVEVELDNNSDVALDLSISIIIREG